jgi:hypothetical protein
MPENRQDDRHEGIFIWFGSTSDGVFVLDDVPTSEKRIAVMSASRPPRRVDGPHQRYSFLRPSGSRPRLLHGRVCVKGLRVCLARPNHARRARTGNRAAQRSWPAKCRQANREAHWSGTCQPPHDAQSSTWSGLAQTEVAVGKGPLLPTEWTHSGGECPGRDDEDSQRCAERPARADWNDSSRLRSAIAPSLTSVD